MPERVAGYGPVRAPDLGRRRPAKRLGDIDAALAAAGIGDGATLSFHHHLRDGDRVLNLVLEACAARGLRDLTIAASSIFPVHAPLVEHMRTGVVTGLHTAYARGPVAEAVSHGGLARPMVLTTHGGRARAIAAGELVIDAAFIAAPAADEAGNLNGVQGRQRCGPLGYAIADAAHARRVIALTDDLVAYPAMPAEIGQDRVDHVVEVPSIGDARGIMSGTTRPTEDPAGLEVARLAARVIEHSGLLKDGFAFQAGAGGISLAVAAALAEIMQARGITGSFASGGITAGVVAMRDAGLFRSLLDVQCFDLEAVDSYARDPAHQGISASLYANPNSRGAVVDMLDVVILGAAEVDLDFDVNVTTGSDGRILGGSGGHSDTAAGARLAIVTTRLTGGGHAKLVEKVTTVTTPGAHVGAVVTEAGIAVHPDRSELEARLRAAGLPVVAIADLVGSAAARATRRTEISTEDEVVAVLEYRTGGVIDIVRRQDLPAGGGKGGEGC